MKIVALGDSITAGFPYSVRDSWTACLARELNCEVINQGVNGDYTAGMRSRFVQDVLRFMPSHVLIMGGGNDAAVQMRRESVQANFTAMIEMSRENGIIPVLGLPIPILLPEEEQFLAEYREWQRSYAEDEKIFLIDFYGPVLAQLEAGQRRKIYVDWGHPSREGYALMGDIAVSFFNQLLPEKSE